LLAALLLGLEIGLDVLDVALIIFNELLEVEDFLLALLNLRIVLFDSIEEPLSGFCKRQIQLVSLQFEFLLLLLESGSLFPHVLGHLLEFVLSQLLFGLSESAIHIFEGLSAVHDVFVQMGVLFFQALVLVSLLGVQIVQLRLVCVLNLLDFLLEVIDFALNVPLLPENSVQILLLSFILVLYVKKVSVNIFGISSRTLLILSQVSIGKFAFKAAHFLDQSIPFALKCKISLIIFVDFLYFVGHLLNFVSDKLIFLL